ncbi:hypothetical protein C8R47DRAFT_1075481 [Mycena vitilis]|nr:hypothetical protein C8R47DRAFT_1075481 [Mycena vitilis]
MGPFLPTDGAVVQVLGRSHCFPAWVSTVILGDGAVGLVIRRAQSRQRCAPPPVRVRGGTAQRDVLLKHGSDTEREGVRVGVDLGRRRQGEGGEGVGGKVGVEERLELVPICRAEIAAERGGAVGDLEVEGDDDGNVVRAVARDRGALDE